MFAGDTPPLIGVMASARHVARQLGHPRVRSEHLLAALADDHLGTASVLSRHGVSAAAAREAADAAGPSGAGVAADRSLLASLGIQAGSLLEAANIERPFGRQPQFPLGASVASRRCDAMTPPVGLDAQAAYEASLRVALAHRDQAHRPEHLGFVLVGIDPGVAWLMGQIGVNRMALLADLAATFPCPPRNRLLAMGRHVGRHARSATLIGRYERLTGRSAVDPAAIRALLAA